MVNDTLVDVVWVLNNALMNITGLLLGDVISCGHLTRLSLVHFRRSDSHLFLHCPVLDMVLRKKEQLILLFASIRLVDEGDAPIRGTESDEKDKAGDIEINGIEGHHYLQKLS